MSSTGDGNNFPIDFPPFTTTFTVDAFDDFIRSQSLLFIHYRATRCPIGLIDKDDQRRPHEHHENCSNGFIYTLAGEINAAFANNNKKDTLMDIGRMNGSSAVIVLPRFYEKSSLSESDRPILVAPFDRLYLKEDVIEVVHWQLNQYHVTGNDRLHFPVKTVIDLIDSRGNRYIQGDFSVGQGNIVWGDTNPGIDPETNKGRVYSIRYTYRPFFYIKELLHEVRLSQVEDEFSGERKVVRMPQSALIQREYAFQNEQNDPDAPESPRQQPGPAKGSFGPR